MRSDLEQLLKDFADERGIVITLEGRIRYDAGEIRVAFALHTPAGSERRDGFVASRNEADASLLGLPSDIVGRTFSFRRSLYEVIEINIGRPKYPVTAERVPDRKRFKFPAHAVLSGLKKAG